MCHWPSMTMQTYDTKWETSDSCWISWHLRKQSYDSYVTHLSADFHNSITMIWYSHVISTWNYKSHWILDGNQWKNLPKTFIKACNRKLSCEKPVNFAGPKNQFKNILSLLGTFREKSCKRTDLWKGKIRIDWQQTFKKKVQKSLW